MSCRNSVSHAVTIETQSDNADMVIAIIVVTNISHPFHRGRGTKEKTVPPFGSW